MSADVVKSIAFVLGKVAGACLDAVARSPLERAEIFRNAADVLRGQANVLDEIASSERDQ